MYNVINTAIKTKHSAVSRRKLIKGWYIMKNSVIILAGGQGKRMKVDKPKVLCEVLGTPMLEWVIKACEDAGEKNICVVRGFAGHCITKYLNGRYPSVLQRDRLGTGHAVMQAVDFLRENIDGNTLILCGDAPFIDKETIQGALALHTEKVCSVTVVTSRIKDPHGYGRIIRTDDGISGIVEEKDCTPEQKKINEINSGCYWFKTKDLLDVLFEITPDNAQGEYYLTDCIGLLIKRGKTADAFTSENENVSLGANDRRGLLHLNTVARMRNIERLLDDGVEFTCTDGVIIGNEVQVGAGTSIEAGCVLTGKTVIGNGCKVGPNTILTDTTVGRDCILNNVQAHEAEIGSGVKLGPWVNLRPGTKIANNVKIGDFVEIKNSVIGDSTSISHLTYVGDSDVGENVNFGCGVATANYNGDKKFRTEIGDNAFIGCNTNLIAPVKVGKCAYTAAGSTVTKDVPDGALVIERSNTSVKEGYADKMLKNRVEKFNAKKAEEEAASEHKTQE